MRRSLPSVRRHHKVLLGIDKKAIKQFQADMLTYFDTAHPEIGQEIEDKKVLSDELIERSWRLQGNSRRAGDNMPNIREIQSRINSVKDTMKITNAMYMISSSKLTQAKKSFRIRSLTLRTAG